MSGPKISQAEIERRRQMELAKQREAYLKHMAELRNRKQKIEQWFHETAFQKVTADSSAYAQQIHNEITGLMDQIQDYPEPDINELSTYLVTLNEHVEKAQRLLTRIEAIIDREEVRVHMAAQRVKQHQADTKIRQMMQNIREDQPVEKIIVGFGFDGDVDELRNELITLADYLQRQSDAGHRKLMTVINAGRNVLLSYAKDPNLANNKEEARIHIEKALNEYQEELRRIKERERSYQEYCVLADVLGVDPRPVTDFSDEKAMAQAVSDLKKRYKKKDEMDYIASQINEVMIELGYGFVSSTSLQRKDGSECDYSLYQADEEAGISIYADENGAVMMQMTNLGEGAVTAADVEESYQMQLDFCASHPDIVDALAKKGVILKQVNYLPPSKKYVNKKKKTNKATKKVVDRRKRRRNEKKVRHMQ